MTAAGDAHSLVRTGRHDTFGPLAIVQSRKVEGLVAGAGGTSNKSGE
jgi:hypothetical protein